MLNEEVRKIMTTDPVVASPDQTVEAVATLMQRKRLQQLPVVQDGQLTGIITSYDLWRHSMNPNSDEQTAVREVMTPADNVLTIAPKDKVGTAAELFIDQRFKTLPVVNLDRQLKGVVTAFDVIRHVMIKEYPEPILYKDKLSK